MSSIMDNLRALQGERGAPGPPGSPGQSPAKGPGAVVSRPVVARARRRWCSGPVLGALVALAAVSVVLVAIKVGRPLRGGETAIAAASGEPSSAGPVQPAGSPAKVTAKVTANETGGDAAHDAAAGPDATEVALVEPGDTDAGAMATLDESDPPEVDVTMADDVGSGSDAAEPEAAPAEEALVEPVEEAPAEPVVVVAEPQAEAPAEPVEEAPVERVESAAPAVPVRVLTQAEDEANKAAIRGLKVMAVFGDERGIGVYTLRGELRRGGRFSGMDITQVTLKYVVFECGNKRYKWMLGR